MISEGGRSTVDLTQELKGKIRLFQETEITEYHIYSRLARRVESGQNRQMLEKIAEDEQRHALFWQVYTKEVIKPSQLKVLFYSLIGRVFGFTFAVKLMEKGEERAQENYAQVIKAIPESEQIFQEEHEHENDLLDMLDEELLRYIGSIVLGLNDALVELTGALSGLTLALQNTRLIAMTGLITGLAAALSMGASEYLSTKSEGASKNPVRASIYTGSAYVVTVLFLILPYLIFPNYYIALSCTLLAAILIIASFNYYLSIAKDLSFKRRFFEMILLSFGVAAFSFIMGYVIRTFLGIDV
ncbi:MAG: rubrerythrin family protein [Chloroflexi bacterium RBG_16_48_8]|nr:MAG: rubrerythrin family protein [Chloroflexi bacterium RBG_16_48_8]